MTTSQRIWEFGGHKPLNPAQLIEDATEYGWNTDWYGLANGIECPRGKGPGYGHFLVTTETLGTIPTNAPFSIICKHELGETTFQSYRLIDSQAISKQLNPAHWITVADKRWVMQKASTGSKRFNLRKSRTEYVEGTDGFTWQTILAELWGLLPGSPGGCPTLPNPPVSTPENLIFDGLNLWDCINQVLTATGHIVALDPITSTFTFVRGTSPQPGLGSMQSLYRDRILWDYKPSELPENIRPAVASVVFSVLPTEENDSAPNFLATPHVEDKSIPDSIVSTSYPVQETMFYWDGRETAVGLRATEVASGISAMMQCYVRPWGKVYAGCLEFKPGSQVSAVQWLSDGHNGFCTHVRHTSVEMDWPKLYLEPGGGGEVVYGEFVEDYEQPTGGGCPITQPPPRAAVILITNPPCSQKYLVDEEVTVYDPMECIFDRTEEELAGVMVVFSKGTIRNPFFDDDPGTEEEPNPCYSPAEFICVWTAIDRCCVGADGGSAIPGESSGNFESF